MNLASINIVPRRGNTTLKVFTIFIFQNGRDLEDYMEEFVDTCHRASCDDVCLMEGFRCGLDDDLRHATWRSLLDPAKLHQLRIVDERINVHMGDAEEDCKLAA
ncbi:hypothetical protein M9458_054996 [Cirrhinus mrigala]|uniref:Uncharacterized protein n=1 Tax=Cirrhinus mrigala TaxID=683832 RepID=A0ABD0MKT7_CIRMR